MAPRLVRVDRYDPTQIEPKWQKVWADERTWHVSNEPFDGESSYVLVMLPYPSGEPHIGHLKVYSVGDAIAHYWRRRGHRVLQPMGYDAFGLPAENHAIKTGQHPRESTDKSIEAFRRSFHDWGISIDWDRELATHEPEYYRWTQWLFLQLFHKGLAYKQSAAVNWDPVEETVLANEQVIDGRGERSGALVEVRQLEQWFFRILDYADRLLDDLDTVDWPEHVKTMQRNWIGRSEGAEVVFRCESAGIDYPVFTTRPDTLFGATFFVMAPEHDDVLKLAGDDPEVAEYVRRALTESAEERGDEARQKTGVALNRTVTNPVNGEEIPMFVADYVLGGYGTGAIMAVPAHDSRDFEFATKFGLEIRPVVESAEGADLPYATDGKMINSGRFDGLNNREAFDAIVDWLEADGRAKRTVNYRLRDWLLSRQRYWGCPIPVVYCETDGIVPVPEDQLPVVLPEVKDYKPKGKSPLAAAEDWVNTTCPVCGGPARRETDTMDTFVDSSWYFLRYTDAHNDQAPFSREAVDRWMPIDQYIGGVEHAILHLMYARFFTKALADLDLVGFQEPFARLFTQGMITRDGAKMSKSKGNVVNPEEIVERYGSDTARAYILFIGPADQDADWSDDGVAGINRFLGRLWRLAREVAERVPDPGPVSGDPSSVLRKAHWAIDKVSRDLARFNFNTAISAVMELVNEIYLHKDALYGDDAGASQVHFATTTAASLLFPFAPHTCCEAYEMLTGDRVWEQPWPEADESMLAADTFQLVVQVNGKLRDRIEAPADASSDEQEALAKQSERVVAQLNGGTIVKTIVVPGKLVNFVVR